MTTTAAQRVLDDVLDAALGFEDIDIEAEMEMAERAAACDEQSVLEDVVRPQFDVTDLGSAVWAVRRARERLEQQKEIRAVADAQIAALVAWRDGEVARLQRSIDYISGMVENWHRQVLEADPAPWEKKKKTRKFPGGGAVKAHRGQPQWQVNDEAFIRWAKLNVPELVPALVRTKEEPAKAELKKAFVPERPDGEWTGAVPAIDPETNRPVTGVWVLPPDTIYKLDLMAPGQE